MMAMLVDRLRQILDTRKLVTLRRAAEVAGQLAERAGGTGVTGRLGGVRRAGELGRYLLGDLTVLGRVRLLQLLQGV